MPTIHPTDQASSDVALVRSNDAVVCKLLEKTQQSPESNYFLFGAVSSTLGSGDRSLNDQETSGDPDAASEAVHGGQGQIVSQNYCVFDMQFQTVDEPKCLMETAVSYVLALAKQNHMQDVRGDAEAPAVNPAFPSRDVNRMLVTGPATTPTTVAADDGDNVM